MRGLACWERLHQRAVRVERDGRLEPVGAVVAIEHRDIRARHGALDMGLDQAVRLGLRARRLQTLAEAADPATAAVGPSR